MESTRWFDNNTDCLLNLPGTEVWSCEDCPCAGCQAASISFVEAGVGSYIEDFDFDDCNCDQCNPPPAVVECIGDADACKCQECFLQRAELDLLEMTTDRLTGHRTWYLAA